MSPAVTAPPLTDAAHPDDPPQPTALQKDASRIIALLKEYEEKLHELSKRAYRLGMAYQEFRPGMAGRNLQRSEFEGLKQRFSRLQPSATELVKLASPMAEYKIPQNAVTLLELKLRLTDFEHALFSTEDDLKLIEERMK